MRRRRTTTHEIDFALPLISGEYLNVVLPGQTHRVPEQAVGYFSTNAQGMRYPTSARHQYACGQWHG